MMIKHDAIITCIQMMKTCCHHYITFP
jgi:hypothetical protein